MLLVQRRKFRNFWLPVVAVHRITNRRTGPTPVLILTFSGTTIPNSIKVGYENCRVSPYIPNPLRCFNCQQFGHHGKACTKQSVCAKCSSIEHTSSHDSPCAATSKCTNCHGPHASFDRSCPVWKREQEVQKLKVTLNISFPEARKMVQSNRQTATYAAAVAKKSVCEAGTQTDFVQAPATSNQTLTSSDHNRSSISPSRSMPKPKTPTRPLSQSTNTVKKPSSSLHSSKSPSRKDGVTKLPTTNKFSALSIEGSSQNTVRKKPDLHKITPP